MAITFPISLKAVVIGKVLTAFIYFEMNAFMLHRLYNFGAFKQLICYWKGIAATVFMAIAVVLVENIVSNDLLSSCF